MAPKGLEYEIKAVMQAVVIAESFDNQFDPISRELPKVMVPLVNTPLLDYHLAWLHRCGIEDVILYCRATPFGAIIKKHCKSLLERRQWTTMSVKVFPSDDMSSPGDALRDLYRKRIIVGDFLLLRADTLGSVELVRLLDVHRANKQRDPKTALTCVLMPVELPSTPADSGSLNTAMGVVSDCGTSDDTLYSTLRVSTITDVRGKVLKYERHRRGTTFSFPSYIAYEHPTVSISCQLPDPNISVCSQDVPGLFADNFDFMTIDGLIKGLVQPDDLNDCSVYQYVVREGYATTVATWRDYERTSLLMVHRRLSPLCPEISLTSGRHRYQHSSFNHHYWTASSSVGYSSMQDEAAVRSQTNRLAVMVVCGDGVEISGSSEVRCSVLGNHCKVGDCAKLDRVFVGNNCSIEKGCQVTQSYLGNNVTLLSNTVVEPGCVVASDVTLGPDQTITRASLVATKAVYNALDEFERDVKPVAISSTGYLFPRECSSAGDASASPSSGYTTNTDGQTLPVWGLKDDDFLLVEEKEDESYGSSEEDGEDVLHGRPMEDDLDEDEQKELEFLTEVMDSLINGIREEADVSKVALEINGSRYAYNISLETMQIIVFKGVLRCYHVNKIMTADYDSSLDKGFIWPVWPDIKLGLHRFKEVLMKYLKNTKDYLNTMERMIYKDEQMLPFTVKILYELGQELELLDDGATLLWFRKGGTVGARDRKPTESFKKLNEKVADFLTWLENAEEESTEEDSSEEEE